jgi:hypothetical protein
VNCREFKEAVAVVGDDIRSIRVSDLLTELINLLRAWLIRRREVVLARLMFSVWCP